MFASLFLYFYIHLHFLITESMIHLSQLLRRRFFVIRSDFQGLDDVSWVPHE